MLQLTNGVIVEDLPDMPKTLTGVNCVQTGGYVPVTATTVYPEWASNTTLWWSNYPVYVCTDKTKKAIEILKALQADK